MSDFVTVFDIGETTTAIQPSAIGMLAIGVLILFGIYRGAKAKDISAASRFTIRFFQIFACVAILVAAFEIVPRNPVHMAYEKAIRDGYKDGKSKIVEGYVDVLYRQKEGIHSADHPDRISISGKVFEIDYWGASPGYRQSIAFGGALKQGVYARVHYYDGVLLKVEIKRSGSNSSN